MISIPLLNLEGVSILDYLNLVRQANMICCQNSSQPKMNDELQKKNYCRRHFLYNSILRLVHHFLDMIS